MNINSIILDALKEAGIVGLKDIVQAQTRAIVGLNCILKNWTQ